MQTNSRHIARFEVKHNPKPAPHPNVPIAFGQRKVLSLVENLHYSKDDETKADALKKLWRCLSSPKDMAVSFKSDVVSSLSELVHSDATKWVLAVECLALLATAPTGRDQIQNYGTLKLIKQDFVDTDDPIVKENIFEVLINMSSSSESVLDVVDAGYVACLANELSMSDDNQAAFLIYTMNVLMLIAKTCKPRDGLDAILDSDILVSCVHMLRHDNDAVRFQTVSLLDTLTFHYEAKDICIKLGAVKELCSSMNDSVAPVRAAAASCIANVCLERDAKETCVENGGLDALEKMLNRPSRDERSNALRAMAVLVVHPEARKRLTAAEIVATIEGCINEEEEEKRDNQLLHRAAKTALREILWKP